MTGVAVLREVLTRGARVVFDPPDNPRLLAPPSLHERIKADRDTIKEILRRAAILRHQFQTPGPLPILVLPEHPGGDGCLSCGDPMDAGHFRCPLCALAINIALEVTP
jgi:hypothetical protein